MGKKMDSGTGYLSLFKWKVAKIITALQFEIFCRDTLLKYKNFRQRCNNFFMEVVSQLCFAEGTPPSQEVIKKLLSYIIGQSTRGTKMVTKELTVFQDSIDPTPVVRSFLLQHLLQTRLVYMLYTILLGVSDSTAKFQYHTIACIIYDKIKFNEN